MSSPSAHTVPKTITPTDRARKSPTEGDESEAEGSGSESEESEEEGPGSDVEEAAFEDQQQKAVPIEGTPVDKPRGLGYKGARHRALELAEGPMPSTFEIGQSSRFVPDQHFDPPSRALVQTSASPEWSSGSLPVSPASLTVQSPIASPVTTPAATTAVDEDEFLEVQAQLELHGSLGAWNEGMSRLLLPLVPYGDQCWPLRPGQDKQTPRELLCGRLEEEGPGSDVEEAAFEDQQQKAVPIEGTPVDKPRGLGYKGARHRALELAEGPMPSTFEIGQSSRFVPDQHFDPPSRALVQTSASPEWSSGSLPVSPASLTVQSPIASPVTTPAATTAVDEDEFLEARYEDQREIHTLRMHHIADQREMQGLREHVMKLEMRMDRLKR
ncbi:hypothetical protein Tco_0283111 [Tanacetum coccineum]